MRSTFLVVGRYGWGRGSTRAAALREAKRAGASSPYRTFRIDDDGTGALPYVNEFGQAFHATGGRAVELVRGKERAL